MTARPPRSRLDLCPTRESVWVFFSFVFVSRRKSGSAAMGRGTWRAAALVLLALGVGTSFVDGGIVGGSGISDSGCPRGCRCDDDHVTVICTDAGLDAVPHILPAQLRTLIAPGNRFSSLAEVLYSYGDLRTLDLSRNQLLSLDRKPFLLQTSLTRLDLSFNRLSSLEDDSFVGLQSLEVLNLTNNALDAVSPVAFRPLTRLRELYLGHNRLGVVYSSLLDTLSGLTVLDLSWNRFESVVTPPGGGGSWRLVELNLAGNPLEVLGADAFRGMRDLRRLDLADCRLVKVDVLAFDGLNGLEWLDLSSNRLEAVPSAALKSTPHLLDLFLGRNEFKSIPRGSFGNLTHLRKLDLSHSYALEKLGPDAFLGLENLVSLNMSKCGKLYLVGKDALAHLPNLKHLSFHASGLTSILEGSFGAGSHGLAADLETFDLSGVPLSCDCDSAWLRDPRLDFSRAACHSPKEVHGVAPSRVPDAASVFACRARHVNAWLVATLVVVGFGVVFLVVAVAAVGWRVRARRRRREAKNGGRAAVSGEKNGAKGLHGVDASRDFVPFLPQYHHPTEQVHYAVGNEFIYMPAGVPGATGYKLEPVTDL